MQLKTSVRNLVEFLLRSGDIDNRRAVSADGAMVEGGRIHVSRTKSNSRDGLRT